MITTTKRKPSVSARMLDECAAHPDDDHHECLQTEMRCAYCGVRLDPWPCNGCGKFLTAKEMSGEALCGDGTRCDECA